MMTFAAGCVVIGAVVGVVLTMLTLPGIWVSLAIAALCWWWQPDMFENWTMITAGVLALLAEVVEFAASAAGASKAGGTRKGAIGSIIGGVVGAIVASPLLFPIGTILGGAVGAGIGAFVLERHKPSAEMTWKQTAKVGAGAATGRLVATILKTGFAVVVALLLTIAVMVGGA
ncbi:MAG: DUF456 domain-containing protein [Phycisphaerales bacterium]|nr:DUF456 domain-containing protein [Phycisphaerales bacterium]